jgi:hypothetical protein
VIHTWTRNHCKELTLSSLGMTEATQALCTERTNETRTGLFTHGYAIRTAKSKMNSDKGKGRREDIGKEERRKPYENAKARIARMCGGVFTSSEP